MLRASANAGRPPHSESEPEQRRPDQASSALNARTNAPLGDTEEPDEDETEHDDDDAKHPGEDVGVLQEHETEGAPEYCHCDEDDREAGDEEGNTRKESGTFG